MLIKLYFSLAAMEIKNISSKKIENYQYIN